MASDLLVADRAVAPKELGIDVVPEGFELKLAGIGNETLELHYSGPHFLEVPHFPNARRDASLVAFVSRSIGENDWPRSRGHWTRQRCWKTIQHVERIQAESTTEEARH
jgi:hypothetical protein